MMPLVLSLAPGHPHLSGEGSATLWEPSLATFFIFSVTLVKILLKWLQRQVAFTHTALQVLSAGALNLDF